MLARSSRVLGSSANSMHPQKLLQHQGEMMQHRTNHFPFLIHTTTSIPGVQCSVKLSTAKLSSTETRILSIFMIAFTYEKPLHMLLKLLKLMQFTPRVLARRSTVLGSSADSMHPQKLSQHQGEMMQHRTNHFPFLTHTTTGISKRLKKSQKTHNANYNALFTTCRDEQ